MVACHDCSKTRAGGEPSGLAAQIIAARQHFGWSQEKLALYLGVIRTTVARWEIGTSVPRASALAKLTPLFEITEFESP